ncbi:hypothetical protein DFH08DRAFT_956071 [Mycena albidolilacea]|uniref:F-box domain-containing protein n=1 Tax=Mycena albidolilacea TaxID=1033008 RepID=A0AAD7EVW2_9AGAR|nr:hypothetical protein DFH08DRAFT_956071 [Mycena albidolilacea]
MASQPVSYPLMSTSSSMFEVSPSSSISGLEISPSSSDLTLPLYINESDKALERLRKENARLKQANSVLQDTNNVLLLKLGPFCRRKFAELPHEILLMIFRHVLPPRWLLSGLQSLATYPDDIPSADLRMKHTLLSICKSWNQVGTELLYESVVLRRILQLPVFVRALEGRDGLGPLVKHLNLNCFPPRGYCQLYENGTRRILALCPNISHFGFSPPFLIPGFSSAFLALPSSITSLEYPLPSQSLAIPSTYDEGHPVLLFGRVEDVCLIMEQDSVVSPSKWLFPNLRKLRLNGYVDRYGTPKRPKAKELIDAYGARITFLGLFPDYSIYDLHGLLSRCPVLEHLVVRQRWVPQPNTLVASHTVKFVDVLTGWKDDPYFPITVRWLQGVFPALREVRNVGGGIFTEFRDIPLDMPKPPIRPDLNPGLEEEDEIYATVMEFTNPHSLNGCAMIDECILRSDSTADGYDDSDAESCSTVSEDEDCSDEDLADEFYMGEDWELGYDEALIIFDEIQRSSRHI